MSYNIDGKVVNQYANVKIDNTVRCEKCSKIFSAPLTTTMLAPPRGYIIKHYIHLPYYIYETKSGIAVVYCSDYCRKKHNHRFTKRTK
jgi:hypothetical protein